MHSYKRNVVLVTANRLLAQQYSSCESAVQLAADSLSALLSHRLFYATLKELGATQNDLGATLKELDAVKLQLTELNATALPAPAQPVPALPAPALPARTTAQSSQGTSVTTTSMAICLAATHLLVPQLPTFLSPLLPRHLADRPPRAPQLLVPHLIVPQLLAALLSLAAQPSLEAPALGLAPPQLHTPESLVPTHLPSATETETGGKRKKSIGRRRHQLQGGGQA
ncbi:hypothetical protein B484DRAFT_168373 [Ochromonadaceae sp. CCMP2298]|nr:hypothetical protein B484DRAFT_168373 [Ochromonadaceae sp. CCMP2298]